MINNFIREMRITNYHINNDEYRLFATVQNNEIPQMRFGSCVGECWGHMFNPQAISFDTVQTNTDSK